MTASEEAGPATRARVLSILPALEDTILKGMADWHVPGAAVAVVVDDEVVMAKGFGVRDVTQPAPVGPETVFSIGSTTKAFAAGERKNPGRLVRLLVPRHSGFDWLDLAR
jgi:CubicO group peptidase (beta-lactamase class C family)